MPSQKLVYRLVSTPNADQVRATFDNQTIEVKLPQAIAEAWTQSTDVGIYTEQSSQTHSPLKLLIEKDFFCLKPRSHEGYEKDDKSDMYPHPNAATGMC